jgi:ketosteroid isomerase-like protein
MERYPLGPEGLGPVLGNAGRILATLLTATFPGRDEIAQQVATARGRVIDADGSLELSVDDAPPANVVRRIPVEAEAEDIDGMTFHVLLHVVDGYINELEIYRDDSLPLQAPIRPEALRVLVF